MGAKQTKLIYCKGGKAVSDFEVEDEFRVMKQWSDSDREYDFGIPLTYRYSTENIFNRVRFGIQQGEIDAVFEFEGELVIVNSYGVIPDWPKGFCEYNIMMAEKIITGAVKRMEKLIYKED